MTDVIKHTIEEIMSEYEIPYCIYVKANGEIIKFGNTDNLEEPDLSNTLFYDSSSISGMLDYLKGNKQPRILSQGNVKSIIGTIQKDIFGYFINSTLNVIEYYEFAKIVHLKTKNEINEKI